MLVRHARPRHGVARRRQGGRGQHGPVIAGVLEGDEAPLSWAAADRLRRPRTFGAQQYGARSHTHTHTRTHARMHDFGDGQTD